ncbi:phylloplanin-like [Carica papaya]|uniref:phylloplanin-like n=1 Tax=Carica papaya TaxID=3649 RepID=UPI000B8D176A|nr:phylloplanin-like [Carica papaya]
MAFKSSLLFTFLLISAISAPIAQSQLGLIGQLLGLIRITGTVFCTSNGNLNVGVNASSTPVFPNAGVQLQCGGKVVSSATTNGSGVFSMVLDPLQYILSSVLANCKLAVTTPLAKCDANLPDLGHLLSSLQFVGNTLLGLLNVANLVPTGFQFDPST